MAHFAELDENNIVVRVLVTDDSLPNEGLDWLIDNLGGTWLKTSYNGNIRKNYAGLGFSYDSDFDAFIPLKPYDSWLLVSETAQWQAPIPYPIDGLIYQWDESVLDWMALGPEMTTS